MNEYRQPPTGSEPEGVTGKAAYPGESAAVSPHLPIPGPDEVPSPPTAPVDAADPERQEVEWRKLHRVTPLLNAWKGAAAVVALVTYQFAQADSLILEAPRTLAILGILGAIVLGLLVGLISGYLAWRRTSYGMGEQSIFLHSGVLFRRERHVRLDRIQSVEVTQPLVARIFGYAALQIESAGGAESNLSLRFLTQQQAQELRAEIMARSAGITLQRRPEAAPSSAGRLREFVPDLSDSAGAIEAPERPVLALSPGRLVASMLLSGTFLGAVGVAVALLTSSIVSGGRFTVGLGAVIPLIGVVTYVWSRFSGNFNFRVAISADGIRVRSGLTETKARTIPPGRVQAVQVSQPFLWRLTDWWRIEINIAGQSGASEESAATTILYPVAKGPEVYSILALAIPDIGTNRPIELIQAGQIGMGADEGYVTSPDRAKYVNPLVWRRAGFAVTGTVIVFRSGRITRWISLVPHARTQSMGLTQGPLARWMNLITFNLHSTPGPVWTSLNAMDRQVAEQLLVDQSHRAKVARDQAGPEQWMRKAPTFAGVLPPNPRVVMTSLDDAHIAPVESEETPHG